MPHSSPGFGRSAPKWPLGARAHRLGLRGELALAITLPTVAILGLGFHSTVDGPHSARVANTLAQELDLGVHASAMVHVSAMVSVSGLLDHLSERRHQIDSGAVVIDDALRDYTEIVNTALMAVAPLSESIGDPALSRAVAAYVNLLEASENAGLERATLTIAFARGELGPSVRTRLQSIVGAQAHYVDLFTLFASPELRQLYVEKLRGDLVAEAARMLTAAQTTGNAPLRGDPARWFQVMTGKIERMREVEDEVATDLRRRAAAVLGVVEGQLRQREQAVGLVGLSQTCMQGGNRVGRILPVGIGEGEPVEKLLGRGTGRSGREDTRRELPVGLLRRKPLHADRRCAAADQQAHDHTSNQCGATTMARRGRAR